MMPDFSTASPETWPMVLTIDQVAAILQRKAGGIGKAAQQRTMVPAPFLTRPWRWRRADVLRFVDGARGGSMRRVG